MKKLLIMLLFAVSCSPEIRVKSGIVQEKWISSGVRRSDDYLIKVRGLDQMSGEMQTSVIWITEPEYEKLKVGDTYPNTP